MSEPCARDFSPRRLTLGLLVGACCYAAAGWLPFAATTQSYAARMAAGITGFVASAWLSGAMPLAAASLVPLCLMPALGVMPIDDVASSYSDPIIWMFFGGFVLALGVERWGLHHRLALHIIARAGAKPDRLILGFMAACAFLSMGLNNTSTTLLLLPIALALIDSLAQAGGLGGERERANFAFALLIGIAYAASIGGVGTPIGTAPNALFFSNYALFERGGAPSMGFLSWMSFATPFVVIMIPGTWWLLTRVIAPVGGEVPAAREALRREAAALAPMGSAERRMAFLFGLAALLWITRRDLSFGDLGTLPGWWRLLPVASANDIGDGAVAVFVAVLAFIVPSGRQRGEALMSWDATRALPWDILLLIGGGIAIARSFETTGLARAVGLTLEPVVQDMHPLLMVALVTSAMTFLTEVTSNTAITALFLPILSSAAVAARIDPRLLMLPATLAASCAFMLPIATPPNAIVFATGHVPMGRMAAAGWWVNLLAIACITALIWWVAVPALGIAAHATPAWLPPPR